MESIALDLLKFASSSARKKRIVFEARQNNQVFCNQEEENQCAQWRAAGAAALASLTP